MKHTIYSFWLLLLLSAATPDLRAQCSVELGPDAVLTCFIPQYVLNNAVVPANATYVWAGPNGYTSTQAIPVVTQPGIYSVTITDPSNGCTATDNVVVTTNFAVPGVTATGGTLSCTQTVVTLNCIVNGQNPVYQWTGPGIISGAFTANPVVNQAGVYTVTVMNNTNGCTATATAVVTADVVQPTVTATGGTLSCAQQAVTLTASGNPGGVAYAWSGPGNFITTQQNPTVTTAGTYVVTVTSFNGCTATAMAVVDYGIDYPQVTTNNLTVTPVSCNGLSDGTITILPTGGTGPYSFNWTGPSGFTTTLQNLTGLHAGNYSLTLTDNTGCSSVRQVTLSQPSALVAGTPAVTPPNCAGSPTGSIILNVAGGSPPYIYLWNTGATFSGSQNLPAGTYVVTITDAHGCTVVSGPIALTQPAPIQIASLVCENTLTAIPSGGVAPYQYFWSDGEQGATAEPLQPGSYTVTVLDANGCTNTLGVDLLPGNAQTCTFVTGRVALDLNDDCLVDAPEIGLGAWYLKAEGPTGTFYGVSDSDGHYRIRLVPGDYAVSALPPSAGYTVCLSPVNVSLAQTGDSAVVNFSAQGANPNCPAMTVDLSTGNLRRCFSNNFYTVQYCNNSPAAAPDAYIVLTLDPFMSIVSSVRPFTSLGNNMFRFELDTVAGFDCDQFKVYVNISCNAVLGQTHCSQAHIYPDTICFSPNPLWSGAEVDVRSECVADSLHFILKNIGVGPMTNTLDYIVIEDGIMGLQGSAPGLAAEDSMIVKVPANGSTWRIEAMQAAYFPGQSYPVLSVEGCSTTGSFSTGYVQQFPLNDADPFVDEDCTANIGSYDPNDKQGMPLGYGAEHYIRPGTDLEYLIRFQNTGTDTAFTVIVRDTLSPWLDPASVRPGGSSHGYHFEMTGNGVLVFDFQNILLPDSNVNEAASHGYVKFRVKPRLDVPLQTDIFNRAAIYFDFNDPVITNTTMHRIGERFVTVGSWQPQRPAYRVRITPHPVSDASWLDVQGLPATGDYRLQLYSATGRLMQEMRSASPRFRVEKAGLPAGAYLFRIEMAGALAGQGVLIAD